MRLPRDATWYAICAVLCVCAHPTKEPNTDLRIDASEVHDLQITATGSVLKDTSADGLSKVTKSDLANLGTVLIPLKSATTSRNGFAIMALPIEPDAEMLPAHYTGVKPPGVDHMELRRHDPETLESHSKMAYLAQPYSHPMSSASNSQHASGDGSVESMKSSSGGSKAHRFEKGSEGSIGKADERTQYSEAGGIRRQYSDEASDSGDHQNHEQGGGGNDYALYDNHNRDQNSKGYHHVYHKDEQKKSADYYKNDNHGGKFKKHGHYNEKHMAHETDYKKGASHNSGSSEDASGKKGMFEKAHVMKEAKGHEAREGHDQYTKNFKGFGQQGESMKGRKFGFANSKGQ